MATNDQNPVTLTEITLDIDSMTVVEDRDKTLTYTFSRDENTDSNLTVNFTLDGTAKSDTDFMIEGAEYDGVTGTVIIAAGEQEASVTITPKADAEIESDESIKLTVSNTEEYIVTDDSVKLSENASLFRADGNELDNSSDDSVMKMGVIANDDPKLKVDWAKQFGGSGYGYEFLAVDDAGNTYVTGSFETTVTLGGDTLTPEGSKDLFVAKVKENGEFDWAKGFGGTTGDSSSGIDIDDKGNTYITGEFSGQITFGDTTPVVAGISSDVFAAKLNSDGNAVWAKDFGNGSSDKAGSIAVDKEGNAYITGNFLGEVTFGDKKINGGEEGRVVVSKLDSDSGDVVWAEDFGAASKSEEASDEASDIVVDKEGNAYLFMTEQNENGAEYAVVTKLDKSDGSETWTKKFGNNVVHDNIAIGKDSVYITGEFEETLTFDNAPNPFTVEGGENGDVFVGKLDSSSGNLLWVKDFDSQDKDENDVELEGIAVDDMGNTYVTGYYQGKSMRVDNFMLYGEVEETDTENAFITKFDSKGKVKWAQNIGGTDEENISDIAVNNGKIYIAGKFFNKATFGDESLEKTNSTDTFLVKLEEEKPEISLTVDSTSITEGDNNQIIYTFTRKGDTAAELTVDFSVTGSATFNDDYTLEGADEFQNSKGKVTFQAGKATATVTLSVTNDTTVEQDKTLALSLEKGSGYMLSATENTKNITIISEDIENTTGSGNGSGSGSGSGSDNDDEDEGELSFISNGKSTFKFKSKFKDGKSKSSIKFSFKSKNIEEIKQIAFFTVDDDEATIDGISPDAEGYIEAALNRAQTIFSVLGNAPQGFDLTQLDKVIEFSSDIKFRFLSVKNGTVDGVKKGKVKREQVVFSNADFLQVSEFEKNGFDLDFEGVKINMKLDGKAKKAIGSGLQEKIEVLDLREITTTQTATFTVNREAQFNNTIGFYQVINEDGGIDTNGDGTADILVGDAGYAQAAVQNRLASIDLSVENQSTGEFTGELTAGAIVVPFLIVNGNPEEFEEIFFPFIGANSDGADHVMMIGDNAFGFEDLAGGGDRDFNDVIVKVDINSLNT
ncbi:Calx-beta domain-containing protein [Rivularia sp. PCC 7116]|uniref:SBBP repeat-containing protein n=1 Tax=Rivularia sp. PCC 7116 TaxID=373994 RepID=UPI00029EED88|nr:SBBP repeat-containing protein [Rivularia sp. PCC 7116]AFY54531.1 Calx-beta domain-containing protein [Rivularia sp. PCC 7116]